MIEKANKDIRRTLERENIYQWQVAEKLGMQDSNFSKLLRTEMTENKKRDVLLAIKQIIKERLKD